MAIESIAKTLGSGSGIDIGALVENLVEAQFQNKNALLTKKNETLTTQISKLGELKSGIAQFATALSQLTANGALQTQPTSSNTGVIAVTRLAGASLSKVSASLEVKQLAQGQVSSSTAYPGGSSTAIGTGTLTLTFGSAQVTDGAMDSFTAGAAAPIDIEIDSSNNTLAGIATAINTANKGVTAQVLSDSTGARLVLKSNTGASQAFSLSGTGGLSALNVGVGSSSTINTAAQDALVSMDGVPVKYPVNSITTLIDGVRLDLTSAAPGTKVTIGASVPTTAIGQTVTNFVDTYNEVYRMVKAAVDPKDGPLRGDPAAKNLFRQLKSINSAVLNPNAGSGDIRSLSDIGVATQRDGTLSVNTTQLARSLNNYPSFVEAIFSPTGGLTTALNLISTAAVSTQSGLGASEANYSKAQATIAEDRDDASAAAEKMRARMTQQFAAMDSKVAAYKSTQSFLTQQVAAWNSSN